MSKKIICLVSLVLFLGLVGSANGAPGLKGEYYYSSGEGPPVNAWGTFMLTRTDLTVDFSWGTGSPHPSMRVDDFAVRWTGNVKPRYTETYTFITATDDGTRLWVNNQLIIDHWVDQGTTEWTGTITLQAGQEYPIRFEYYENGGDAVARLFWQSASQTREIIPSSCLSSLQYFAHDPRPWDGEEHRNAYVLLEWEQGDGAADVNGHDVYFGDNPVDVIDGTGGTYKGRTSNPAYFVPTLIPGTTYYWRVDEINEPNIWPGDIWSFTVPSEYANLPSGWANRDIGTTGGSASESAGVWTITGDGHDIYASSDYFHYVFRKLVGDGEIYTRVSSVGGSNSWRKAGVMIRETLDPNSKNATIVMVPSQNAAQFQWRSSTGGSTSASTGYGLTLPEYIKLVRQGNQFSAYHSSDGISWTQQGSTVTIYMAQDVYIGFAVSSTNGTLITAVLDNLNLAVLESNNAWYPRPETGAQHTDPYVLLEWVVGDNTADVNGHDVYFGDNLADVNAGTGGTYKGRTSNPSYFVPALTPGTTYYWRVDEVSDPCTWKGDIWSFTVPAATAYGPNPPDGAISVLTDVILSWKPGVGSVWHDVYFGDNYAEVAAGTGGTYKGRQSQAFYDPPGDLEKSKQYFWRIDEVEAGSTVHVGSVWRFTTIGDIPVVDVNLVGWWKFDEGPGTTAVDYSGNDRHGTVHGDPQWVAGRIGNALDLDGDGDYVEIEGYKGVPGTHAFTVSAWIKTTDYITSPIAEWGGYNYNNFVTVCVQTSRLRVGNWAGSVWCESPVTDGEWHHVAVTVKENATISHQAVEPDVIIYLDGKDNTVVSTDPDMFNIQTGTNVVTIGGGPRCSDYYRFFKGIVDDVRIYDKVLTEAEVQVLGRVEQAKAWHPFPANGATGVSMEPILSWISGSYAPSSNGHYVYFGADDPCNMVLANTPSQPQSSTSYSPGLLDLARTYFWRVNEVNETSGGVDTGDIWKFTVTGYLAVDDMESYGDANTPYQAGGRIFYVWRDGWDQTDPYAMAGNNTGSRAGHWPPPGIAESSIVHGGSQSMPFYYDNDGNVVGNPDNPLAFYSEATAETQYLAVGSDWTKNDVKALSLWFKGYRDYGLLEGPSGTYTMTAMGRDIWDSSDEFTFAYKQLSGDGTIEAKVVSVEYTDYWTKAGVMIRETLEPSSKNAAIVMVPRPNIAQFQWRSSTDGLTSASSGYGIALPQYVRLVRQGNQFSAYHSPDGISWTQQGSAVTIDMPSDVYIGLALTSHNVNAACEAKFSDVQATSDIIPGGSWSTSTSQAIGLPSNEGEPLYVALEDGNGKVGVVYHDNPKASTVYNWTEWNIDLGRFSSQGLTLSNVNKVSIGIGTRGGTEPGGSGKMYFDDMRLYAFMVRDRNLRAALEAQLGSTTDLVKLTVLHAANRGIVELAGLEYATNLRELYLANNQISDISSLSGLKNLTILDLTGNPLGAISRRVYLQIILDNNPGIDLRYDQVIYVDANATGKNNGSNWTDAFNHLRDALDMAIHHDEIWVAEGVYTTDSNTANPGGSGDRSASFELVNGVALYGGFPSGGGSRHQRKPGTYQTVLSGDIGVPDVNTDNSYHVVTSSGTDTGTILDGFTITGGNADGGSYPDSSGGGMFNDGRPLLRKCVFKDNRATGAGGGMYNDGDPVLVDCQFNGNQAGYGGAIHNDSNSNPDLTKCAFIENFATIEGGGVYNNGNTTLNICTFSLNEAAYGGAMFNDTGGGLVLRYCAFTMNSAGSDGGAVYDSGGCAMANCIFNGNSAELAGGAVATYQSAGTLMNCAFSGNVAESGGAMHNNQSSPVVANCAFSTNTAISKGGCIYSSAGSPIVVNSILWSNTASDGNEIAIKNLASMDVNFSDVQGSYADAYINNSTLNWGIGNIDVSPSFVRNPNNGGDGWGDDPNTAGLDEGANDDFGDLHLKPLSLCIDAGNNGLLVPDVADLDGNANTVEPIPWDFDDDPRIVEGDYVGAAIVDMGIDEVVWDGAENVGQGESVTLNPGGGEEDPNTEALVVFTNEAEPNDVNVTVVEIASNPEPSVGIFEVVGRTLQIDTSARNGEFFISMVIPFDANDLNMDDPWSVDLMYYDVNSGSFKLAVLGNTYIDLNSRRWEETVSPSLETLGNRLLGDYGVYWNADAGEGFVWANVDHTTDFRVARHGKGDFEPDEDVDFVDFAFFATHWMNSECNVENNWCEGTNLTGDGTVDMDDLRRFMINWLTGSQ